MKIISAIESVDTPEGLRNLQDHLATGPYPHYKPTPLIPGLLIRIDADGRRTTGRFVDKTWKPAVLPPDVP